MKIKYEKQNILFMKFTMILSIRSFYSIVTVI